MNRDAGGAHDFREPLMNAQSPLCLNVAIQDSLSMKSNTAEAVLAL